MSAREPLDPPAADTFLSSILEATADGILVVGLEGRIRFYNSRFLEIWGIPREVIESGDDEEAVAYAKDLLVDPEGFLAGIEELYANPREERSDLLEFRDGRLVERFSRPFLEDGEVAGRVWSFRDVTDRRRAEEELRASEARYRELMEQNLAGVFRTSLDGEILECNDALARMFGYDSAEDLRDCQADDLYETPADRAAFVEALEREGSLSNYEITLRRRDGSLLHALENSALTADPRTGRKEIVGTLVDITDRKALQEELERMALHDSLTGLPNRRLLREQTETALARADREGGRVGLVFIDLVRFKRVNDSLGHPAGDRVLVQVAGRLKSRVRGSDIVARVGGDEFVLLLTGVAGTGKAVEATRRVREAFEAPFRADVREVHIDARFGIALYPLHASNFDELLTNADRAMYRAGEAGDAIAVYEPPAGVRPSDELAREEELREALERDELSLLYQPVYRLPDLELEGVEALVRWRHAEHGILGAAEFVPLAERTRLVTELDLAVLERAVRQVALWEEEGLPLEWVSLNVSSRTLTDPRFPQMVADALAEHGVSGDRLMVEVTERVAMRNPDAVSDSLRKLEEVGVMIAIDDFGTGHAVLAYLKHFFADLLKLDMVFVHRLGEDIRDEKLVEGIAALGHELGMRVLAEGVETELQRERAAAAGCDLVQGFLLGHPVPAEEVG